MDLRETAEDRSFRAELSSWLASAVPAHGPAPDWSDTQASRAYVMGWQRKLYEAGYAGVHWPKEYGGRDASLSQQLIYHEETARAKAPQDGMLFVGLNHGGPTVMVEGTPEQKEKHLPSILRGDEIWCQGFSEPSAGSDLANLQTRALRVGDDYIVTGQKIWTSFAQAADYCELLVRTDPDASKHGGISWLILDMRSEGLEIQPLKTIRGGEEFSQVFLEEVRVPVSSRVGAENDGWRVSNVTLRFERGTAFAGQMVRTRELLSDMAAAAKRVTRWDGTAWDDTSLRREIGILQAELDALWALVKLSVSEASATGVPGLSGSAVKLAYTDIYQRAGQLAHAIIGRAGLDIDVPSDNAARSFAGASIGSMSLSIAAGTSQIQRNIISERILGLPKGR